MLKVVVAFTLFCMLATHSWAASCNFPIKKVYAAPSTESELVLDIPIEVRLLGVSDDFNWYKVKIAYAIGPFRHTYIGWTNIPIRASASEIFGITPEVTVAPTGESLIQ